MANIVYKDFLLYFSGARVHRYYLATGRRKNKAKELYKANLEVAKAFHPLLGVLEVVMRNRINEILTHYFGDPDWIQNQRAGFMNDPSLVYYSNGRRIVNEFLKKEVNKAIRKLQQKRSTVTSNKIVAEQTFGFWTEMFEAHIYRLVGGRPIHIFGNLPPHKQRSDIRDELLKIRMFRNRINHNEPVCFVGDSIDFSETRAVYNAIIHILNWIDPKLLGYIASIDEVHARITAAERIYY